MDGNVLSDGETVQEDIRHEPYTFVMETIYDVFEYDHSAANHIATRFRSNSEILQDLTALQNFIRDSEIDQNEKEKILGFIDEEAEVLSFSYLSRHSVIEL